jgi:hypothetical protein
MGKWIVAAICLAALVGRGSVNTELFYRFGEDGLTRLNAPRDASGHWRVTTYSQNTHHIAVGTNAAPGSTLCFDFEGGLYNGWTHWFSTLEQYLPATMQFSPGATNLGVECWVRIGDFSRTNMHIWGSKDSDTGLNLNFQAGIGIQGRINTVPFGHAYLPATTNEWVHVALVRTETLTTFYTNGQPAGTSPLAPSLGEGRVFRYGSSWFPDSAGFCGGLDEARIFTFSKEGFKTNDLLFYANHGPPSIAGIVHTLHPKDGTNIVACVGDNLRLALTALGAPPLTFQWFGPAGFTRTGTTPSLEITNLVANNAGAYYVVITNSQGSATSEVVSLTVTNLIVPTATNRPSLAQQQLIDRRWGMFIHFGIETFTDDEWSDGKVQASKYSPTTLDSDQWASTAARAGMTYAVITAKHHGGFCLWPSRWTSYCVSSSANTNDVLRLFTESCRKYGMGVSRRSGKRQECSAFLWQSIY